MSSLDTDSMLRQIDFETDVANLLKLDAELSTANISSEQRKILIDRILDFCF